MLLLHLQRLHERIAGSRLQIIPRAGHTSTLEEPAALVVVASGLRSNVFVPGRYCSNAWGFFC